MRQGRAGVPALGGATPAAEQLAFDVPEALPIVKPRERAELRAAPRPHTAWEQGGPSLSRAIRPSSELWKQRTTEDKPGLSSTCPHPRRSPNPASPWGPRRLPQLLPSLNQAGAEEGNPGKPQVLV